MGALLRAGDEGDGNRMSVGDDRVEDREVRLLVPDGIRAWGMESPGSGQGYLRVSAGSRRMYRRRDGANKKEMNMSHKKGERVGKETGRKMRGETSRRLNRPLNFPLTPPATEL